jgi:hypothetical protein
MKRLYDLVKQNDLSIYNMLESQNLKPEFFAFRWLTLLLSQDFKLPGFPFLHKNHFNINQIIFNLDLISLWDYLFSDQRPFELLLHVCCAMILLQKECILSGDLSNNIKIFQNYPSNIEILTIINKTNQIRRK